MSRLTARTLAITCLGGWILFSTLAMHVAVHGGAPIGTDTHVLSWALGHRPPAAAVAARWVTATGTGAIPYLLAALAGLIAGRTRRHRLHAVALCLTCLALGQTLRYATMELLHRARPPQADWATHATGFAFPSGHSTTAAITAGILIAAVTLRASRGATPLRIAIGCWGISVGLTRIYLGVHWSTDVLGGWLFATGWLGVCLWTTSRRLPEPATTGTVRSTEAPTEEPAVEDRAHEDPGR